MCDFLLCCLNNDINVLSCCMTALLSHKKWFSWKEKTLRTWHRKPPDAHYGDCSQI